MLSCLKNERQCSFFVQEGHWQFSQQGLCLTILKNLSSKLKSDSPWFAAYLIKRSGGKESLSHGIYYQDLLSPSLFTRLISNRSLDLLIQSLDCSTQPTDLQGIRNRLLEGVPKPKCVAPNSHLRLLPEGRVPTCQFNTASIGNLREGDFRGSVVE